jgi:hypothetical protein
MLKFSFVIKFTKKENDRFDKMGECIEGHKNIIQDIEIRKKNIFRS